MKDVADHAGVSIRTVSNVVNDFPYVSADMRQKVQASLDELGYSMNPVARGLRSGRTGTIALVVPQLVEPYFAQLAQAVIRAAANRGLVVLVETTEDPQMQTDIMRGALSSIADGVLLSATSATMGDQPDVPLVLLGEHRPTRYGDYVGLDNVAAARTVVRHLLEQGCRRIAPLGVNDSATAHLRHKAFRAELRKWKVSPVEELTVRTSDWSPVGGHDVVTELLSRGGEQPDAIFAFNDSLAYGAMRALREAGLEVPGDVAVAGMDDLIESAFTNPPLTSLAPDIGALSETAVALLLDQIERKGSKTEFERVQIPFELRVRESTHGSPARRRNGSSPGSGLRSSSSTFSRRTTQPCTPP